MTTPEMITPENPITFNYVIAHNIIKEHDKDLVDTEPTKKCFVIDDAKTLRLAQSILDSFGKGENKADIGQFKNKKDRTPSEFSSSCCIYADKEDLDEQEFINLSKKFYHDLKIKIGGDKEKNINPIKAAIGGYIVALHYTHKTQGDFLLFAIIRDENKLLFTPDLELQETATINTDKLRLAFKIRLDILQKFNRFEEQEKEEEEVEQKEEDEEEEVENYNFLYVIGATEKDKTNYFADVIGYIKGKNSKKSTEALFKYLKQKFTSNKHLEKIYPEVKDKTEAFFNERKSKHVTLNELQAFYFNEFGNFIPEAEERENFFGTFADEMSSDEFGLPNSFVGHPSTYIGQTHITLKDDDYELRLKSSRVDTENSDATMYLNTKSGYITIRIKVDEETIKKLS